MSLTNLTGDGCGKRATSSFTSHNGTYEKNNYEIFGANDETIYINYPRVHIFITF